MCKDGKERERRNGEGKEGRCRNRLEGRVEPESKGSSEGLLGHPRVKKLT